MYNDEILKDRLQEFLITEEVKQLANGEDVELTVFIDEQEYKDAYIGLMLQRNQASDDTEVGKVGERRRRTPDSFLFLSSKKDEVTMMKLEQAENKLELEREKRITVERENVSLKLKNEKLEEGEEPSGRRRRTSDSFLVLSPKSNEVTLMKLEQAENTLELEREKRQTHEKEILELKLEIEMLEVRENGEVERPRERRRRNSDSDLYRKAKVEEMREREKKQQFLENEKYAFIERYLETAQDTYSITTETSDSGLKTHGEPSELGIEDSSVTEETPRLCLRHLNAEATDELRHRIDADAVAARRICQSFGIPGHIHAPTATGAILTLFPDTPLKLLRDVFEALNLCDLVELLDKAATKPSTPRLLRSVITLDEIRILRNADSRPESLHSKAAVLIFTEDEQDSGVKGIEKFFKYLNLNSIVIILKHSGISILKSKEFERKTRRRTIRKLTNLVSEHKQKGIPETDMEVRQLTERLQIERKNLERLEKKLRDLSEATEQARTVTPMVIHEWIQCQDYFSFFAVFDFWGGDILDALVMKLAREIPNKPKFVFTRLTIGDVVPETLLVADIQFDKSTQISLPMILEKRWVTMDLVAMMDELKRSVKARRGKLIIKDTLSSLPVFMKEEE